MGAKNERRLVTLGYFVLSILFIALSIYKQFSVFVTAVVMILMTIAYALVNHFVVDRATRQQIVKQSIETNQRIVKKYGFLFLGSLFGSYPIFLLIVIAGFFGAPARVMSFLGTVLIVFVLGSRVALFFMRKSVGNEMALERRAQAEKES